MLFNSLTFIVFFAVLLAIYYLLKSWKAQKWLLLIGSYLFYAAWSPPFVILIWISTLVDWIAAKKIETAESIDRRRIFLVVSLLVNLGLLGYFKYHAFALENFGALFNFFGLTVQSTALDIVLPVGISFYTFQTLSYTLDVYHRRANSAKSFLDFALYVTFFPQLVAGPIVRSNHFIPQCATPKRAGLQQFHWGIFLMTLGIFQKVVLADTLLSPQAEAVFGFNQGPLSVLDSWTGVLAFSGQIFFDFSGYSICAIGAALCFGFSLPDNFRFPYAAIGFSDFWRRWHISLSTWLRDYLYIPLGGNRKSDSRTIVNLMLVMLIGGLWHGASWTFVVWGGLHGFYLVVERSLSKRFGSAPWVSSWPGKIALGLFTYFLVNITWVFFRADTFESAGLLLQSMFGLVEGGVDILTTLGIWQVFAVIFGLLVMHWSLRNTDRLEESADRVPIWLHTLVWAVMIVSLIMTQGGGNAFIYFQF